MQPGECHTIEVLLTIFVITVRIANAVILCCLLFRSAAQTPLEGPIDYPQLGISFTVPAGWVANESEGLIYLGSEKAAGLILMSIHELRTMEELEASLGEGFSEDGIELFAIGKAEVLRPDVATMEYNGKIEDGSAGGLGIAMLNPHGNGISIVALSLEKTDLGPVRSAAMALMESVRFRKVEYTGPSAEHWRRHLTNTRLTRIEGYSSPGATEGTIGGGYSSEVRIDLCAEGFTLNGNSLVSAGGADVSGSSGGRTSSEGKWDVVAAPNGSPLLQLDHANGERSEFKLDEDRGKVYLNGERWYRTWEGEHAPDCGSR